MKKGIVNFMVTFGIVFGVMMPVMASITIKTKTISLPANQAWTGPYFDTRTGSCSYMEAGCDSVYPISGSDNFTKIQVRVKNDDLTVMSPTVVLTEGKGLKQISIYENYYDASTVCFEFRGNSSKAANAVVEYRAN